MRRVVRQRAVCTRPAGWFIMAARHFRARTTPAAAPVSAAFQMAAAKASHTAPVRWLYQPRLESKTPLRLLAPAFQRPCALRSHVITAPTVPESLKPCYQCCCRTAKDGAGQAMAPRRGAMHLSVLGSFFVVCPEWADCPIPPLLISPRPPPPLLLGPRVIVLSVLRLSSL